jgi:Tfp pilus assembly protein PilZ
MEMTYQVGDKVWVLINKSTDLWVVGKVIKITAKRVKVDTRGIRPENTYFAKHNVIPIVV